MKRLVIIVVIAAVAAAAYMVISKPGGAKVLGKAIPADAQVVKIGEAAKLAGVEPVDVAVKGEVTQKCPTSGCWFYVKDESGSIRVDTQFSGFNVLGVPSGSTVTVHGKISKPEDGEPEISAAGMAVEK